MNSLSFKVVVALAGTVATASFQTAAGSPPKNPRFSIGYMDRSVKPGTDFYQYADGTWVKNNPVPPDKSRWGAFNELQERNWYLIHEILDEAANSKHQPNSPGQKVADFYRSAMDTNRLEQLNFSPIQADLDKIEAVRSLQDLLKLLADFHTRGIDPCFNRSVAPDAKESGIYAFYVSQGGLSLPDRDYYLADRFSNQRAAFADHMKRIFVLAGDSEPDAKAHSATVLEIETALAKVSKSRTDLRDPIANYNKFAVADVESNYPDIPVAAYLAGSQQQKLQDIIIRQPEFFQTLSDLLKQRPLGDWKTYVRWHLLMTAAPYLHQAVEDEWFDFFSRILRDQQEPEPRWQRAAQFIDAGIGEALGQIFVEKHFPPAARARMAELVSNIKEVFRDRLQKLDWMTEATRSKALTKFERFTEKVGHPQKFRDYSRVEVRADDLFGNVTRAAAFESSRNLVRVGLPVDKSEWHMTPQTVNAYFNPSQNEIVFPAGILQPPFFDLAMDDAVNYGGIGVVIGHEITHGYDDQGRKFDAEGNLTDWWTADDARAFEERAEKVVKQYDAYEILPGVHVNGRLTLGENIADLGGTSIAYEALQRALARNPSKRKNIEGLTPEQRFFISLSQIWRTNIKEAEARRRITVDPHSPGRFRAVGPHVNLQQFFDAFAITDGERMWRAPALRAKIW